MKSTLHAALLGALLTASAAARAEWSVNAQIERFRWTEKIESPGLVEDGGRAGIGVQWTQNRDVGLHWRYRGNAYAGSVRYEGQELFTGAPLQSTTDYAGIKNEVHALYRADGESLVQLLGGIGWDYWQRSFPSSGQREDWNVAFLRAGIETAPWRHFVFSVGVKYPLYVNENSHLTESGFDQNPELRPGRELSLYGEIAYRLSRRWQLTAYYDSYRFSQSPTVFATSMGQGFLVFQPRSTMDMVGLRLDYFF